MYKFYLLLLLNILIGFSVDGANKLRIACVGSDLTIGVGVVTRERNAWPAQLGTMLGPGYQVMNFGKKEATFLEGFSNSYVGSLEYQQALASRPDIVFIEMGYDDCNIQRRSSMDMLSSQYEALVVRFKSLPSRPRVVLLSPLPIFLSDSAFGYNTRIEKLVCPLIQRVAYAEKVEIINLYPLFVDSGAMFPDKVHPSSFGAHMIARRLYEHITSGGSQSVNVFSSLPEDRLVSNFYGYECASFNYNGSDCKIVKPRKVAVGKPWIWRARFWGHEPQTDIALLERGYHVVFCDVAELFGNKEAIERWNRFYALMQKCGLAKSGALEAMSRGGVYAYNWALANPGKVACIYADAPVLDLLSWPGQRRASDAAQPWQDFKNAYGLSEAQALEFKGSPFYRAEEVAALGFNMLHVVGDDDQVVPVSQNTLPFAQRVKAAGGNIEVIHKPGIGHHPHSLKNPTPIVDFILRATGHKLNSAALSYPGFEYSSGVGKTD